MKNIKIVKRASGYQARFETVNGFPVRITGCKTKEEAINMATRHIDKIKAVSQTI